MACPCVWFNTVLQQTFGLGTHLHRRHQSWTDPAWSSPESPAENPRCSYTRTQTYNVPTLTRASSSSSAGVSLNWPFLALPIAVRFANVMTTSSGFLCRTPARPRADVEAALLTRGARTVRVTSLDNMVVGGQTRHGALALSSCTFRAVVGRKDHGTRPVDVRGTAGLMVRL